jgi:hypothetical protein
MQVPQLVMQKRVIDGQAGSKVFEERVLEVYAKKVEDEQEETIYSGDWETIFTIPAELQKDPSLVLRCVTDWLSLKA